METALGAAYWRSNAKKRLLGDLLAGIANSCANLLGTTRGLQAVYDRVDNSLALCTKRTARKPLRQRWESQLGGDDSAMLQDARLLLQHREQLLKPSSPGEDFEEVQVLRELFQSLKSELRRKAVHSAHENNRLQAENHAGTWKLLASFKRTMDQPEAAPATIFEHYKAIGTANDGPLTVQPLQQVIYGPLTREDAELEAEVTSEEVRAAINRTNPASAPGPDGLTPSIIASAFSSAAMLSFLARIFTACGRLFFTPEQWRRAENFVLYKGKGDRKNVNSFRAISLTQILAKVIVQNFLFVVKLTLYASYSGLVYIFRLPVLYLLYDVTIMSFLVSLPYLPSCSTSTLGNSFFFLPNILRL
jgi:hypothetical protein